MRAPLTVAAAQPRIAPNDLHANARAHADLVRAAGASIVVFPELSLTGYELAAASVSADDEALRVIADACAETGSVALAGAPVTDADGARRIAMLRIRGERIDVLYRKSFLGGDEAGPFAPGDGPAAFDVEGWRVGVGICKDTGVHEHVAAVAALGIDLYAAGLVHLPDELALQEERAAAIARACNAYVAFASFAGPTGGGYGRTAGSSSIWRADGSALARASAEPGDFVRATLSD